MAVSFRACLQNTALLSVILLSGPAAYGQQVPKPESPSEVKSTPPGTVMTKAYVEMVGRLAYVFGWPLVNNLNRAEAVKGLPEPGRLGGIVPVSPPGYVSMLTDYIDAAERFVTCPNQDTVYGAGFQRLDSKPVVVQVPDFADRFFTYQITDARTDSFASIGKQHGTKPVSSRTTLRRTRRPSSRFSARSWSIRSPNSTER